MIKKKANHY